MTPKKGAALSTANRLSKKHKCVALTLGFMLRMRI